MNEVESLFLDKAIERAGLFLYRKNDALNFIEECKRRKIVILGFDGFKIAPDYTQPSMSDSIDISLKPFNENSYEVLLDFIKERNDDLFFEIVCE